MNEESSYCVGMLVEHPKKPEWGPGKVVHVGGGKCYVIFRDLPDRHAKAIITDVIELTKASSQSDPILDNLPPVLNEGNKWFLPDSRLTHNGAMTQFLKSFPKGFDDPRYRKLERGYKVEAHKTYIAELESAELNRLLNAGSHQILVQRALHVIGKTNLLSMFEAVAIRDGLRDLEAAQAVFVALDYLLRSSTVRKEAFEQYVKAISNLPADEGKARVFTWPVVTILPYLANPKVYMFLKPGVTQKAAKRLAFDLHYSAKPNWTTYDALLRMGKIYLELLKPHGAKDLIDVQSFIWKTGYEPKPKRDRQS